jgi:hypothetical protein
VSAVEQGQRRITPAVVCGSNSGRAILQATGISGQAKESVVGPGAVRTVAPARYSPWDCETPSRVRPEEKEGVGPMEEEGLVGEKSINDVGQATDLTAGERRNQPGGRAEWLGSREEFAEKIPLLSAVQVVHAAVGRRADRGCACLGCPSLAICFRRITTCQL